MCALCVTNFGTQSRNQSYDEIVRRAIETQIGRNITNRIHHYRELLGILEVKVMMRPPQEKIMLNRL